MELKLKKQYCDYFSLVLSSFDWVLAYGWTDEPLWREQKLPCKYVDIEAKIHAFWNRINSNKNTRKVIIDTNEYHQSKSQPDENTTTLITYVQFV